MIKNKQIRVSTLYLFIIALTAISFFPLYWMIITSLKPQMDIFSWPPIIALRRITMDHYFYVLFDSSVPLFFLNSLKVTIPTALLVCMFGSLAAYGFSRFTFKSRGLLLFFILATQTFPTVVLILPFYILWKKLGLLNTHFSLIVTYTGFQLPIGIWLLKIFFDGIPKELEEASLIDGCSKMQSLLYIVWPIARAGIASVFIYLFIAIWNEYIIAYTFINKDTMKTLSVGLVLFKGQYSTNWGAIMASATLTSAPVIILFSFLQKFFIRGIAEGALKA